MYLTHLSLEFFRNYARLEVDLQARVHVLSGANAQGKTNLLESIYFLATTKSPLAGSDRELIGWAAEEEPIPYARVEGRYHRGEREHTLSITMVNDPAEAGAGPAPLRRQIRVDGVPRRAIDAVGMLNVVLFLPEDIALVGGPPGGRRRYLDVTLCQIDPLYCRTLSRYNRVLAQRNALLRGIREGRPNGSQRDYWDEQLVRLGSYVLDRRRAAVASLGELAGQLHPAMTVAGEGLALSYQSTVEEGEAPTTERFHQALAAARRDETARGLTLVGPHRDDLRFLIDGRDATTYGSRGQQRTVALSLKLAEVSLMRAATGETPVLLLDDVLSELDRARARQILGMISQAEQVLLTTTDVAYLSPEFLEGAVLWEVAGGALRPLGAPA
jgi:DNA replication and repair protein RecF